MPPEIPACPSCHRKVWTYRERGSYFADYIFGQDTPKEREFIEGDDDHELSGSDFTCRNCGWTTEGGYDNAISEFAQQEAQDALYALRDDENTQWRFR